MKIVNEERKQNALRLAKMLWDDDNIKIANKIIEMYDIKIIGHNFNGNQEIEIKYYDCYYECSGNLKCGYDSKLYVDAEELDNNNIEKTMIKWRKFRQ
ncbi:UNVERIFIED_ORG: hypothetical protein B2H93_04820 [Clostridium botulinum]